MTCCDCGESLPKDHPARAVKPWESMTWRERVEADAVRTWGWPVYNCLYSYHDSLPIARRYPAQGDTPAFWQVRPGLKWSEDLPGVWHYNATGRRCIGFRASMPFGGGFTVTGPDGESVRLEVPNDAV